MTAATTAPVRHRTSRAAGAVPLSAARLLRVELRRNTMPWILPLIAALFWFDSYRPSTGTSPLYGLRTFWNMGQGHTILDFGPFVAGVAAWMGSRDGRRGLADLMTTTARPRWAAQLATWAATAIWAVTAYLVFVGVMFAVYAHQGVAGTPPWWYVAVGVTAVAAFSAVGFAIGAYWPSRFAAPVAAFGAFLAMFLSFQTGFSHTSGWALILPTNSNGSLRWQRPDRLRNLLPLAAGPADRPDPVPRRDRRRGTGPDRPARPGRRPRGCAAPPPSSRSPARRWRGPPSGWPAPPRKQRKAWSSPRCTTPRTTRRLRTLPSAVAPPGSRCA